MIKQSYDQTNCKNTKTRAYALLLLSYVVHENAMITVREQLLSFCYYHPIMATASLARKHLCVIFDDLGNKTLHDMARV